MTNKYIITNCPARNNGYFKDCVGTYHNECQDCTDCLLKQIVEKCKPHSEICKKCNSDDCLECEHLMVGSLANKILSMLEIQECE